MAALAQRRDSIGKDAESLFEDETAEEQGHQIVRCIAHMPGGRSDCAELGRIAAGSIPRDHIDTLPGPNRSANSSRIGGVGARI